MTRIQIAVETLHNGGYFRKALESSYRGGEKFCMRLRDEHGHVVRGVGFKTFFELQSAGKLVSRSCTKSSTWPEEWVAAQDACHPGPCDASCLGHHDS